MSKRDRDRLDPFDRGDLEDVADEIYGKSAPALDVGRVVAMPTPIHEIWADVKQPRRAVPASIRLHWNGNPGDVLELLNQWHIIASKIATVDIYAILQGNGEGLQVENAPPIFTGYVELLRLAASIRKDGLINPISIIEEAGRFLIETGERRWLAYHVLHNFMGTPEWSKVPASRSDGRDYVWRQATENTARRQLNAIGMARQLALLIMETRRGIEGQTYNDFEELVLPGGCDRKFYAQIANGNIHRIPKGSGERIQNAMGLSESQLSHYRSLLKLTEDEVVNDALWIRADVEDWPEKTLRELATFTGVKVREIVTREEWGLEDLRSAMEGAKNIAINPTPQPPPRIQGGEGNARVYEPMLDDRVRVPAGHIGTVVDIDGRKISVQTTNGTKDYYAENLTLMGRSVISDDRSKPSPERPATPISSGQPSPAQPRQPQPDEWTFQIGEAVAINATGDVLGVIWMKLNRYEQEEITVQNEKGHTYDITADQLTSLMMTYEDYLYRQHLEPEPEPEVITDKVDSVSPEETIIQPGSKMYLGAQNLMTALMYLGEDEASKTFESLCLMTKPEIDRLDQIGKLKPILRAFYGDGMTALERQVRAMIAEFHPTWDGE